MTPPSALLRDGDRTAHAAAQLNGLVRDLLAEGAAAGDRRDDVTPDELANYCLFALAAAASLPSPESVQRLVAVTLTGLRADPAGAGEAFGHHRPAH
ncbi:SbtR family transcriptional regulator [Kitasatospora sp. NPDC001683]